MDIKAKARERVEEILEKFPDWGNNFDYSHLLSATEKGYLTAHSDIMAELGEVEEVLETCEEALKNNQAVSFLHPKALVDYVNKTKKVDAALTKLRELMGDQDAKD